MDTITFWKYNGRDLERILGKAHEREVSRLREVLKHDNHHVMDEERYALDDLSTLKMIRGVVINMNRDEKIDSQSPTSKP